MRNQQNVKKEIQSKLTAQSRYMDQPGRTFYLWRKDADDDDNYQVNQAKIAIAKGGFFGVGPGNSTAKKFFTTCVQ